MKAKILVVDDDPDIATVLRDRLESTGYETVVAGDGIRAIEAVERDTPNLMLLDMEMPRLSGLDVLKQLAQGRQNGREGFDVPVIVMTAHGTIDRAVDAMKEGAYDFLTKPIDVDHLAIVIRKAFEREVLKRQVAYLRTEVETRYATIVGASPQMTAVVTLAKRAAESDASVLLLGESGTGKELFARSIHQWSPRRGMPFVVINCVALSETLLENELFGHEKGAYTGADRQEKGKIETADGGTVFLDEIGDMPLPLQSKLLRVLQDREFHRVGGTRLVRVNIRVIAATNKDLKEAVKAGRFREDLFFRLNVIGVTLPPLRDRASDLPQLAEFFLKRYAQDAKRLQMTLTAEALAAIGRYHWPGNIRELENAIARAVVLSPGDAIGPEQLALSTAGGLSASATDSAVSYQDLPYHESMEEHSRMIILRALRRAQGSQTKAAELLQLQRTYLARLIRQKGISGSKPPAS
ncbi:MAG: sigma-54-dependent Fis family transcriptional regulator [Nitrospirae bacterium]|nr:MAG: sigma-54-dependent Fis family transcriptional regulator [Nitrospirota bacterium]